MTQSSRLRILYVMSDYASTLIALLFFLVVRYNCETLAHSMGSVGALMSTPMVKLEILLYPLVMLFIYWLSGYYSEVIMKSRIQELLQTVRSSIAGIAVFFLVAMINDLEPDRLHTYKLLLILAGIQFGCTYVMRFWVTAIVRRYVREGTICRNTLIVGIGEKSVDMFFRLKDVMPVMGMRVKGFVSETCSENLMPGGLAVVGFEQARQMINERTIQTVVIVDSPTSIEDTLDVINYFLPTECDVLVDPEFFQKLSAPIRTQNVLGEPLVDVSHPAISGSTANIKRSFDVVASVIALLLLWPVMLIIAILVKRESPGPAIYSQVRIGRHKKPFKIYKFRSMYKDAEKNGPRLTSENDTRITPLGRKLRKYRLDELPQFWNIIRGDMSLVGPRPEREYFIKQIVERAPSYALVQQVRPGLTSWGMVKYGYASTVEGMVERLRYELMYIDNLSILLDLRIIIYTIKIVITGRGI
ncbi:MAG: sugar transferase [Muribaculum sp.]|nr:sugar transferase [Muribaculaceae bacterium]MCM1080718.1 sugar transferase [Muribaculum sp.]